AADRDSGFYHDSAFKNYVQRNDKPHPRWDVVLSQRPPVLGYWYRQSPRPLDADGFQNLTPGVVTPDDPPPIVSGMVSLLLDPQAGLAYFQRIPPDTEERPPSSLPAGWTV